MLQINLDAFVFCPCSGKTDFMLYAYFIWDNYWYCMLNHDCVVLYLNYSMCERKCLLQVCLMHAFRIDFDQCLIYHFCHNKYVVKDISILSWEMLEYLVKIAYHDMRRIIMTDSSEVSPHHPPGTSPHFQRRVFDSLT